MVPTNQQVLFLGPISTNIPFITLHKLHKLKPIGTMARYKPSPNRKANKQIIRRLGGLSSKAHFYGKLPDIELAMLVLNKKKKNFYVYLSQRNMLWLRNIDSIVSLTSILEDGS
jgi:hypothetical protein